MKGPERPCSIKPQQTSSRNVSQRSVEPAAKSSHFGKGRLLTPDEDSEAASLFRGEMSDRPSVRQCRVLIYFNPCMDMSYAWIAAFARAATSAAVIPGL